MYAVIKAGGRQHRVKPGDVIEVELGRGQEAGQEVEFRPLLVVDDDGKAHVGKEAGKAVVVARLVGEQKGDKVKVFKYRPKTGYARKQGHRALMTLVEIADVRMGGRSSTPAAAPSETPSEVPAEEPATGPPADEAKKGRAAEAAPAPESAESESPPASAADEPESASDEPESASEDAEK